MDEIDFLSLISLSQAIRMYASVYTTPGITQSESIRIKL